MRRFLPLAIAALLLISPATAGILSLLGAGKMASSGGGGALSCSYTPVTTGTISVAYTGATPSASGGTPAYTFSETGTLPGGLSISSSTGVISGTPTASGSFAGIQVIVTDSVSGTANCGSSFTLTISAGGGTPPTIDGHAITGSGACGGSTTCTISLTTTSANDLIVVVIAVEKTATSHITVSGVAATGLTFTKRSSNYQDNVVGPFGTTWNSLEVWSATATSPLTAATITVTTVGTIDCGVIGAFGTKINGTNVPTWTSNSPSTTTSTGTTAPSVGSIASNKAALLVGFAANAGTTNQTIGSGFTLIDTNNNPAGAVAMALGEEYKSFSAATSGQTVAFGASWQTWLLTADAIEGL